MVDFFAKPWKPRITGFDFGKTWHLSTNSQNGSKWGQKVQNGKKSAKNTTFFAFLCHFGHFFSLFCHFLALFRKITTASGKFAKFAKMQMPISPALGGGDLANFGTNLH
jgi:hypothetical protein